MNIRGKKILCVVLSLVFALLMAVPAFAVNGTDYKITNPYESVAGLLADPDNHYKTNLHAHSIVSDGDEDFTTMIKGFYDQDYDIVGMAEHGVIGKNWNEKPTQLPLYLYQRFTHKKPTWFSDADYNALLNGTYASETRTKSRGMNCVPTGIELNMLTLTKSHVTGYFCNFGQNDIGFENGFEYAVKNVEKRGGLCFINHPGDWLEATRDYDSKKGQENIRMFTEIYNKYQRCCGMEIFNDRDIAPTDRILWDRILERVIPNGERNVFGFANSDAHNVGRINTSFMDFIMPEYTEDNLKSGMQNGTFFAIGRYARQELGGEFYGDFNPYPVVTSIVVDDEKDTITVTGKNTDKIQWVANGDVIFEEQTTNPNGEIVSTIHLRDFSDKITCYVRFQLSGKGGMLCAQPFICDDGNMARFVVEDTRTKTQKFFDDLGYGIISTRFVVLLRRIVWLFTK